MQGEGLGDHDQPADGEVVGHRRQGDVADLGAFLAEEIHRRVDAGARGVRRAVVGLEEMPDHADAQPLHALAELGGEVRHRPGDARRILGIVAGHALQQQRAVLRRPGHRPGVIEREGERQDADAAAQAVGRLDAGDAAERRRSADRSAGVRPGAAQDQSRGNRRAGARGRSRREVLAVPGIARRRPRQVERRPAEGELVRRELAQHHRARLGPLLRRCARRASARCPAAAWNAPSCGCRRCCRCPCGRSGCRRAVRAARPTSAALLRPWRRPARVPRSPPGTHSAADRGGGCARDGSWRARPATASWPQ